jgi:hypothetical protein
MLTECKCSLHTGHVVLAKYSQQGVAKCGTCIQDQHYLTTVCLECNQSVPFVEEPSFFSCPCYDDDVETIGDNEISSFVDDDTYSDDE